MEHARTSQIKWLWNMPGQVRSSGYGTCQDKSDQVAMEHARTSQIKWLWNMPGQVRSSGYGTLQDKSDQVAMEQFPQHGYSKREQAVAYQQEWEAAVSDTHDTSQALIQVNFSEKYTCVAQDKIQGSHWEQH